VRGAHGRPVPELPHAGPCARLESAPVEQAWLDELSDFLRIPSVSADPAHAPDVRTAAEWVRDLVRRAGGEAELVETDAQPLVIGELRASKGADSARTILVYGHFDVQPPSPLELWESDPFEAEVRGEWIYARGVADDKGQLWTLLKAAEQLAAEGALPVNLRIACDGEEEIGGHSIVEFLERDERGADACIIFDSAMEKRGVPALCTATRGVMSFSLEVRTGQRDLHSGVFGNAALNATHALMQALGGIMPRDGRLPEALRVGAAALSDEERASWGELRPGKEVLGDAGAVPYDELAAEEFYFRTTAQPAVDVNGILGGKPALRNTTVPASAQANFSVRLAPGQDVETISAAVDRLVREAAPSGAEVTLTLDAAAPPGLVSPDEPAVQIALDAFEHVFGRRPLLSRTGGTLPIVPALADQGIPTILTGIALPESNIHSPNERVLVEYLPLGVQVARELYTRLAAL
jgi:acetylornithine deacetylase/succinyl-diaminopimelate desuccinylase-like protein